MAPNRLPEAPLPNEAPMSAPLPCWISTRPIIVSADSSCTARIKVIQMGMVSSSGKCGVAQRRVQALQMAMKSAAFNEAPPIKPPSMSGCENNAAALSALTLPP